MLNDYIPKVLSKRPGGFFNSLSTLLIMDSATSHATEAVRNRLGEKRIDPKIIHGGLTPLIQYLDTHVNKSFNGRRIYPFNKGLRIYGGCTNPLLTR